MTMEDGLSNNEIFSIIQDKQGYIWLSTADGLDRYDGYTFKVFRHDPNDATSISGNLTKALYEDGQGRLWVSTYSTGLNLYDPTTGTFKQYRHIPDDPNSLISNDLWSLNSMPDGRLLIGTHDSGLDILDPESGKFSHFPAGSGPDAPGDNRINQVFLDSGGHVWLATANGLDEFDPTGKGRTLHFKVPDNKQANDIIYMAEDSQHRLWLATAAGPYIYLPGHKALEVVTTPTIYNALGGKKLYTVFIDAQQNIWYGGAQGGLYVIRNGSDQIQHYEHQVGNNESLSYNIIDYIFKDRAGYLWFGTVNGANVLDPGELDIYSLKPSDMSLSQNTVSDTVMGLHQYRDKLLLVTHDGIFQFPLTSGEDSLRDKNNVFMRMDTSRYGGAESIAGTDARSFLVGTESGDLLEVNAEGAIVHDWRPRTQSEPRPRPIRQILPIDNHHVYLGEFGGGLVDFDLANGEAQQLSGNTPTELAPGDIVEALLQVTPRKLWIATFRGVFQLDTVTRRSSLIPLLPGGTEPVIQGMYEDPARNLWIASYDGLWRVKLDADGDPTTQPEAIPQFRRMEMVSIEPDNSGHLWVASINTLMRYDPNTGDILSFGRDQGSPISEYYSYGHIRTSDGRLWFGGGQGAVGFLPQNLQPNHPAPSVLLDNVTSYRDGQPLLTALLPGKSLELSYRDTISVFDVAATDFGAPRANTYSYRLLGLQSQWTPPKASHEITFTNLSPGRYRLEVRAANNWGILSAQPASLDIVVLPPWWRTWWAYTLYLLIIIGSAIGYVYSLKRKIEREKQVSASLREANDIKSNFVEKLQTQVAAATRELRETLQGVNLKNAELEVAQKRAAEGEQVKSQFLAHMSHELRTPLTGILGFIKLLGSSGLNSEQKDYVGTIHQSSETLLAIINDTLDLSKLDAGKLLIDEVDFDLLEVIESTLELLAPTAYQKRLELVRVIPPDVPLQLRGDPLRLRQILTNLLSNAIKFTESGAVAIQVGIVSEDEREAALSITVSDTGIGISEIELPQLFHAYARSRISTRQHVEGTGLGLAICKKLLDLMGGSIQVKSKVGSGTSFEFKLKFKLQKNAQPRVKLPRKLGVALYDKHPLSSIAWRASLTRLGADVREVADLEMLMGMEADAAVLALSERELAHLGELKQKFSPMLPPMLILAPRIERQALKDLSEALYHRVLSKSAREKTVYLELQSLVQTAIQTDAGSGKNPKKPIRSTPDADAPYILVADDNRINRRLLVTMLSHAGFRTGEAANGHELLDLAARGHWDAALLDIHMPGMDGIETATRLRAVYGESVPPIIAMSADVMPETRNQMQQGITDDFIMKPFSEQELVDKLRWHLDRHMRKKRHDAQSP